MNGWIDDMILIITGTVGTLGFALVMNLKKKRILYAVIGGCLTSILYVIMIKITTDDFVINLFPTMAAVIYSEMIARMLKAPVTIFMIPSLVPLIPGGALYRTMSYVITSNKELSALYGIQTIKIAFSIAVGIVAVSSICNPIFAKIQHKKVKNRIDII